MLDCNKIRTSLTLKIVLISLLTLVLFIPLLIVQNIIAERSDRYEHAVSEIEQSWSKSQLLAGPVLAVPYTKISYNKSGEKITNKEYVYSLPQNLIIHSKFEPTVRYRSIYETVVYSAEINMSGLFVPPKDKDLQLQWDKAFLILGLSDVRGFIKEPVLVWNGEHKPFFSGTQTSLFMGGIHAPLALSEPGRTQNEIPFSIALEIKGSNQFTLLPLGAKFEATMQAPWSDPSFEGNFLPTNRQISDQDFSATWEIPHLARSYPQAFTSVELKHNDTAISQSILDSQFGVRFIQPLNNYKLSTRAAKYGLMFIAFTFIVFFLFEANLRRPIHILQYALVGVGLLSFFIILLAASEYLSFKMAYCLASTAIILQVSLYNLQTLKSLKHSIILGGILTVLYGYLYMILLIEDYAFLFGAISLFIGVSLVIFFTRNIEWSAGLALSEKK